MSQESLKSVHNDERRQFIGGSDARIIMGEDEAAFLRLWREKRGEAEPEDLSGNLIVKLGLATEDLNRRWYEANTGQIIADVQRHLRHPTLRWLGVTLDGRVEATGAVFEAKFMLPWSFSEEAAAEKYMAQLQHNMWVVASRAAVLSVITGGAKWGEIIARADPVESSEPLAFSGASRPKGSDPRVRIGEMSGSNAVRGAGYFFLGCRRFRSRRPCPPPFSSMNSIPARSKAARIASTAPRETSRRSFSKSTTVESPRSAACASCDCVIPSSPRAARHWAGVISSTFFVDRPHEASYQ
jgi:hypothetical protein